LLETVQALFLLLGITYPVISRLIMPDFTSTTFLKHGGDKEELNHENTFSN
jgi:hypothetical protein